MSRRHALRLGVVLERRELKHPWQDHSWRLAGVIPGAPPDRECGLIHAEADRAQYYAGTLMLDVFPKETEGYAHNLGQKMPAVYVVFHRDHPPFEDAPRPILATVCPFEAQQYSETGEELVEAVPMPDTVAVWLADYVKSYHVPVSFEKRKRKRTHAAATPRGSAALGNAGSNRS